MLRIACCAAALLLSACLKLPASAPYKGRNNSAMVSGVSVGAAKESAADLRKSVSLKNLHAESEFAIDAGYVLRSSTLVDLGYFAFRAKNNSKAGKCFVKAEEISLKGTSGVTVGPGRDTYVSGSIGKVGTVEVGTCLAPGETGWFLGTVDNYSQVASMEFRIRWRDDPVTDPKARVIPESYSSTTNAFQVAFRNNGSGEAAVSTFSRAILFDDSEQPLMFTFLNQNLQPSGGRLAANATGSVQDIGSFPIYQGAGSKVLAVIEFNDVGTTGLASYAQRSLASGATTNDELLSAWNAEQARREAIATLH